MEKTEIIRRLIGVYELPSEQFHQNTIEERLEFIGCSSYSVLYYDSEYDYAPRDPVESVGAGCTTAVKDKWGKVRPIVFVRSNVISLQGDDSRLQEQIEDAIRLLVLLHEIGHADDIARSINYDHERLKIDIVGAETYAHLFVCRQARKMNYRLLLGYYLQNIEEMLGSTSSPVRLSAERAKAELDWDELKEFCVMDGYKDAESLKRIFERAGRLKEYMKRFSNSET